LVEAAANLALFGGCPLAETLTITPSLASKFFKSKAFADWQSREESKTKLAVAGVNATNNVIRAINALIKSGR
jgi:hypothetical protein